jgi:hypothetical protein
MAGNGTQQSDQDEERPASGSPGRQIVVVPRTPGPLLVLDDAGAARGDDLDVMIDEVFGPSTDEGPGLFDVVLVVAGIALVAWSWLSGGAGPWFIIGITAIVLGVALPARSVVRATREQRMVRRQRRVLRTGHALDASDATVGALVGSYDSLQHAATLPGVPVSSAAVEAGHAALLEVASLLDGRPPLSNEERDYVERRTRAIRDLTAQIIRGSRAWQRARMRDDVDVTEGARERAAAVARAREELETGTGVGAVDELERLRARLRDGDPGTGDPGSVA